MEDEPRPEPRSSTLIPGARSRAEPSHSVIHRTLDPPLAWVRTQSGLYLADRGNWLLIRRSSLFAFIAMLSYHVQGSGRRSRPRAEVARRPTDFSKRPVR